MAADDLNSYMSSMFGGGSDPSSGGNALSVTTPGGTGSEATTNQGGGRTAVQPVPAYQQTVPAPNVPAPGNDANQIQGWYSKFLGRTANDQEIQSHLGNPGGLSAVQNLIANSPEAAAYAKTQGVGQTNPGATGAGTGGPPPATGTNNGGFADPAYQGLLDLVNKRLTQLQTPQSFPQLDQLTSMLQANEAASKGRAQTFAGQLGQRVSQLQQPLLSDANVVQQRALASNGLLGQMDNALARSRENVAQRGFDPRTSGLALNQQNQIDQNYSNAQGNIDAQLQQHNIAGDESRRNTATTLQGLAQQALQGGDLTALQNQSQAAQLENQLFNINQGQANQTLSVGQIPVDLTNQGFTNALNASNSATNPLSSILGLLSLGNQQQGIQQTGQNGNTMALVQMMMSLGL